MLLCPGCRQPEVQILNYGGWPSPHSGDKHGLHMVHCALVYVAGGLCVSMVVWCQGAQSQPQTLRTSQSDNDIAKPTVRANLQSVAVQWHCEATLRNVLGRTCA